MSERHPGKRPSCSHKGPCPLPDECPMCRTKLHAHDRAWLLMRSEEGLVSAANYCSADCEAEAQAFPREVAEELRYRQAWMEGERS